MNRLLTDGRHILSETNGLTSFASDIAVFE